MAEFTSWELDVMRAARGLARRQGRDEVGIEQVTLTLLDRRPDIERHWRSVGVDGRIARRSLGAAGAAALPRAGRNHQFHVQPTDALNLSPVVADFFGACKATAPDGDTARLPSSELASTILSFLTMPMTGWALPDTPAGGPKLDGAGRVGFPADDDGELTHRHGRELTELAATGRLDPLIGREREMDRVVRVLSRRTKRNPLLVGAPGVGKTAIVEGLAARIVAGDVPPHLADVRIVEVSLASMLGGTRYRGEFESRVDALITEVRDAKRRTILFMDEFHLVVTAGAAEGGLDLSSMLLAALARGELSVIGATTTREHREHIRADGPLERRMQLVAVPEPDAAQTRAILAGMRAHYASFHDVRIGQAALDAAVRASRRLVGRWPDTALDLLDDACAAARLAGDGGRDAGGALAVDAAELPLVRARHVTAAAAERTERTGRLRLRRRA